MQGRFSNAPPEDTNDHLERVAPLDRAISGTGGAQTWTTKSCSATSTTGIHHLFLKFTGSRSNLFKFNWWRFDGPGASRPDGGGAGTGGTTGSGGASGSLGTGAGGAAGGGGAYATGGASTGGRGGADGGSGGRGGSAGAGGSAGTGETTAAGGNTGSGGTAGTGGGANGQGNAGGCNCEIATRSSDGQWGILTLLFASTWMRRRRRGGMLTEDVIQEPTATGVEMLELVARSMLEQGAACR